MTGVLFLRAVGHSPVRPVVPPFLSYFYTAPFLRRRARFRNQIMLFVRFRNSQTVPQRCLTLSLPALYSPCTLLKTGEINSEL